jgi:hypothetical protein
MAASVANSSRFSRYHGKLDVFQPIGNQNTRKKAKQILVGGRAIQGVSMDWIAANEIGSRLVATLADTHEKRELVSI